MRSSPPPVPIRRRTQNRTKRLRPAGPVCYLRAAVRRRRTDRLPPREAICVPPSLRVARADQSDGLVRSGVALLRRRGAKASSAVSGVSQDRLPLTRCFGLRAILARMSRRNFRGWPKSLMTREWDFEGVPAMGTVSFQGGSST